MSDSQTQIDRDSPIAEFYRNKTVFLTGATGVLGELFVEKLLRCNVRRIYVLMRSKKQKTHQERIAAIYSTALFDRLQAQDPQYMDRIGVINGDIGTLQLGISAADRQLLRSTVQIVIHAAANVRFDCPLEQIVLQNVRGTREVLQLAAECPLLLSCVYISTAYSHSHKLNKTTEEQFYRAPIEVDTMIRLAEEFEAGTEQGTDMLAVLTDKFISPWTNTYSFSKAVTEDMVRRAAERLPVVVVRPSIVIATHEDPIPGYCTNYFGLNGILSGAAAGVVRILYCDVSNVANLVCSDFVINGTLAIIWDTVANKQLKSPPVYTLNSGHRNLTWGNVCKHGLSYYDRNPLLKAPWIPLPNFTMCWVMYFYYVFAYQVIPALLFDAYLWAAGSKDRMLPLNRRIMVMVTVIEFFMCSPWKFYTDNIESVHSRMNQFDREYFPVGVKPLDFAAFATPYCFGLRKYIFKESIDNMPQARRKFRRMKYMHYAVLVGYYSLIAAFYYNLLRFWAII